MGSRRQEANVERFTAAGDVQLEARIASTIEAVAGWAREVRGLDAVVLGGSLGRGEGTIRRAAGGDQLASDIELYLVGRSSSLRKEAERLEREIGPGAPSQLSVAWLDPRSLELRRAKNLSWRPSLTIRLHELISGSRVIHGRLSGENGALAIDPASLPLAEGVRLVLNRMAESAPEIAEGTADARRWQDKLLIACGDTALLASHAYTSRYADRAERLAGAPQPWAMPSGWREAIGAAYFRKLGRQPDAAVEGAELAEVVRATLGGAVRIVPGIALEPMETFAIRYVAAASRSEELLRYLPPMGPAASYEGLVVLARVWRGGLAITPRMVAQAIAGRPLSLATQAAAAPLLLSILEARPTLRRACARALAWAGLPHGELAGHEAQDLARVLARYWRNAS